MCSENLSFLCFSRNVAQQVIFEGGANHTACEDMDKPSVTVQKHKYQKEPATLTIRKEGAFKHLPL